MTIYHLILEATLGLTTFRFATRYLESESLLPGFVAGYSRIHHDETRHIGYGVWFLRETVAARPAAGGYVRGMLREVLPAVAASLSPGDGEGGPDLGRLAVSGEQIRTFALDGLTRRAEIIGVPLSSLADA